MTSQPRLRFLGGHCTPGQRWKPASQRLPLKAPRMPALFSASPLHSTSSHAHRPGMKFPASLTFGKTTAPKVISAKLTPQDVGCFPLLQSRDVEKGRGGLAESEVGGVFPGTQGLSQKRVVAANLPNSPETFHPFPCMPLSKSKHCKRLGELRPRKKEAGSKCFSKFGKAFQICGVRKHSRERAARVAPTQPVPLTWH